MDGFNEHIARMMSGEAATAAEFKCPFCNGSAFVYASPSIDDRLSLSVSCFGCGRLREMDGVDKWPGWDAILVEKLADELVRLKAPQWNRLLETGELYIDQRTLKFRPFTAHAP
jgi:hypothetical protein